jgi:hypothetical protein
VGDKEAMKWQLIGHSCVPYPRSRVSSILVACLKNVRLLPVSDHKSASLVSIVAENLLCCIYLKLIVVNFLFLSFLDN